MATPAELESVPTPQARYESQDGAPVNGDNQTSQPSRNPHFNSRTPEPLPGQQSQNATTPSTPGTLLPFDWEDFEARYEKALQEADENERGILREAESLAKYFQAWASAASAHDDERAIKRLQTRQRYVNLAEDRTAQKQQHYEEVVSAFESALALLRSR
ncbi:hypothetical protein S40285_04891 [Stachybotrys chlorohalonatus IBT 40285]|uniref:Uncharacterized protein n=1 Tax=Stachybotrys chlorohalonatus (strain IBT 40285) TaxID=1283841 RepID=A0A084QP53_STAC4|nr:hypothetical protein S40285_04891 [Stachybotrys chlorohalonata IBT 40285]